MAESALGMSPQEISPQDLPSLKDKVSDEEWQLRCDLAATYRLVQMFGWDDLVFTHISVRLPDEDGEHRFLINPYGVLFEEMTASSLLKIGMNGNKLSDSPYMANAAGFTIHSAVHDARDDAHCVLHLHSRYGIAVSASPRGLRRLSQHAMQVHDDLAYHDYEGIAFNLDERERLQADLGSHSLLMLKNHGTLTTGPNCAIAFTRMYYLERACEIQVLAESAGEVTEETEEMGALVNKQSSPLWVPGLGDKLVWPGLMRRLRRENPGWEV